MKINFETNNYSDEEFLNYLMNNKQSIKNLVSKDKYDEYFKYKFFVADIVAILGVGYSLASFFMSGSNTTITWASFAISLAVLIFRLTLKVFKFYPIKIVGLRLQLRQDGYTFIALLFLCAFIFRAIPNVYLARVLASYLVSAEIAIIFAHTFYRHYCRYLSQAKKAHI